MFKKGSVVFRDVRTPFSLPNKCGPRLTSAIQYELVDPGSHNADVAADVDNVGLPIVQSNTQAEKDRKKREKARVLVDHLDIIKDDFWVRRPWLLSNKPGRMPKET